MIGVVKKSVSAQGAKSIEIGAVVDDPAERFQAKHVREQREAIPVEQIDLKSKTKFTVGRDPINILLDVLPKSRWAQVRPGRPGLLVYSDENVQHDILCMTKAVHRSTADSARSGWSTRTTHHQARRRPRSQSMKPNGHTLRQSICETRQN
jgi:hypothetical protein